MDLTFSDQDAKFRAEVRDFLENSLPPELKYKLQNGIEMQREDVVGWHKVLYDRGWVAPSWPKERSLHQKIGRTHMMQARFQKIFQSILMPSMIQILEEIK